MKRLITLSGKAAYCQTGSAKMEVGQTIGIWPDYSARFGQLDFLSVLEQYRPSNLLSHDHAVVMHASVNDLENSGGDEWLYELNTAPESLIQRHDLHWTNEIAMLIAASANGGNDADLRRAAEHYWHGAASSEPVWEYLTAQAVVVAVHHYAEHPTY